MLNLAHLTPTPLAIGSLVKLVKNFPLRSKFLFKAAQCPFKVEVKYLRLVTRFVTLLLIRLLKRRANGYNNSKRMIQEMTVIATETLRTRVLTQCLQYKMRIEVSANGGENMYIWKVR